jgi:hypothetical protein
MPRIRLTRREAEDGILPDVCMKCGNPSQNHIRKKFSWHPPWVLVLLLAGLLPFAIVAVILTKRVTLIAPMCDAHRKHWLSRTLAMLGGFVLAIGLLFAWMFVGLSVPPRRDSWPVILGMAAAIVGVSWIFACILLRLTSIRPVEITDYEVTLAGVSDVFIDAFYDDEEDDEPRLRDDRRSRGSSDDARFQP